MTEENPEDALGMLDRVTRILQAFTHEDRGLRLSELARRSGLPKSTVSRLVGALVQQQYLEREGSAIHLGLRVFELGQLTREPRELRAVALPAMAELRDKTGENVHLAIRDGKEMVCVAVLRGRSAAPLRVQVGARLPAHATALGKAVLAHATGPALEAALTGGLAASTPLTITDEETLRSQLATIRTGALAVEVQEFAPDVSCAASAVFAPAGRLAGAISVSGRADEFDVDAVAPLLRAAAVAITRRLSDIASAST